MPLNLPEPITVERQRVTATKHWLKQLVIRWGPNDSGTAVAELVPITDAGTPVERDADGNSLVQSVKCDDLVGFIASGNCPAINVAMAAILKAVEEIEAENERLAAIEAEANAEE